MTNLSLIIVAINGEIIQPVAVIINMGDNREN
jgi:hypothetical protein